MKYLSCNNILVRGEGKITAGIVTNMLRSEAMVYIVSGNTGQDKQYINENIAGWKDYKNVTINTSRLKYLQSVAEAELIDIAVCYTGEDLLYKQKMIRQLEESLAPETIIAVNTDSFTLEALQQQAKHPTRIIGLNWCDPAHTTAFLEIIANNITPRSLVEHIEVVARNCWHKDPYTVYCGYSVKARLMASLAREAFYLVEHGYASIEDIDRACRNDAGYYLPFAGNCRYMDLMGTYAYGLVMKDLNRELSKQEQLPSFFTNLIETGKTGMETKAGFYDYSGTEQKDWEDKFRKFSFEIKEIMDKYPFGYLTEEHKKIGSKITLDE